MRVTLHSILDIFQCLQQALNVLNTQTLHSILDIFQLDCGGNVVQGLLNFTFHSRYIPISLRCQQSPSNMTFTFHSRYIPIEKKACKRSRMDDFTFHSGYIPMKVGFRFLRFSGDFTFHSGYIPIKTAGLKAALSALYIPFWLYSNTQNI